jgi:hypothetical protein
MPIGTTLNVNMWACEWLAQIPWHLAFALACSIPPSIDVDTFDEDEATKLELDRAAWEKFWGWDLIGPDGLLDHICNHMGLGRGTRMGIKRLASTLHPSHAPLPRSVVVTAVCL